MLSVPITNNIMTFKELQTGNTVYVLDKRTVSVEKCSVAGVTPPHVAAQPGMYGMFVDLTLNVDGKTKTYVVSDCAVSAYADGNNTVVTTDVNSVLAELKAVKANAENIIGSIDKYRSDIEKCSALIGELDPVFKKEQDNEKRFCKLEEAVAQLAKSNEAQTESSNRIVELLKKLTKE